MYDKENVATVCTAAVMVAALAACGLNPAAVLPVLAILAVGLCYGIFSAVGEGDGPKLLPHMRRSAYVAIYGWAPVVVGVALWALAKSF